MISYTTLTHITNDQFITCYKFLFEYEIVCISKRRKSKYESLNHY